MGASRRRHRPYERAQQWVSPDIGRPHAAVVPCCEAGDCEQPRSQRERREQAVGQPAGVRRLCCAVFGRKFREVNLFRIASSVLVISTWGVLQSGGVAFSAPKGAQPVTASTSAESKMTRVLRINFVSSVRDGRVEADRSGVLLCGDSALLGNLAFYATHHLPASVMFDEVSRQVIAVGSAPVDRPMAVAAVNPDSEWISIQLIKRPTLLRLSRKNSRFAELHALLSEAASKKAPVAIGVLPADDEIQDVRLVDWHP